MILVVCVASTGSGEVSLLSFFSDNGNRTEMETRRGAVRFPQHQFLRERFDDPVCPDYQRQAKQWRSTQTFSCYNCAGTWGGHWKVFMRDLGYKESRDHFASTNLFNLVYSGSFCKKLSQPVHRRKSIRICTRTDEVPWNFAFKGVPELMLEHYCVSGSQRCPIPLEAYIPKYFLASSPLEKPVEEAVNMIKREAALPSRNNAAWIVKTLNGYESKGNRIVKSLDEALDVVQKERMKEFLVQEYEMRPLLHNGKKISIRSFVVILSFKPLKAVYVDGPVFRAVNEYDGFGFNRQSHLTNSFFESLRFKRDLRRLERDTILDFSFLSEAVRQLRPTYDGLADRWVEETLRPTLKTITSTVVRALAEHANHSFISHFGGLTAIPLCFDFLVNADLRVWFHEFNVGCGLRGSPELANQWRVDSFGNALVLLEELNFRRLRKDTSKRLSDFCWSRFWTREWTDLEILVDDDDALLD